MNKSLVSELKCDRSRERRMDSRHSALGRADGPLPRTGAEELAAGSDQTAEDAESAGSGDKRKI